MRIGKVILIKGLMPFLVFTFITCQYQDNKVDSKGDVSKKNGDNKMATLQYTLNIDPFSPQVTRSGDIIRVDFSWRLQQVAGGGTRAQLSFISIPLNYKKIILQKSYFKRDTVIVIKNGADYSSLTMPLENVIPIPIIEDEFYLMSGITNSDMTVSTYPSLSPSRGLLTSLFVKNASDVINLVNNSFSYVYSGQQYQEYEFNSTISNTKNNSFYTIAFFVSEVALDTAVEASITEAINKFYTTPSATIGGVHYQMSLIFKIEEQ